MKLPQLSLRDLFWLVALVAMGCGWWVRDRHLTHENESLSADRQSVQKELELAKKRLDYSDKLYMRLQVAIRDAGLDIEHKRMRIVAPLGSDGVMVYP